jgi:hypothetical protein
MGAIEFFTGFEGCGSDGDVRALFDSSSGATQPTYVSTGGYDNGKRMNLNYGWARKNCTAAKTKAAGGHFLGPIDKQLLIVR